MRRDVSGIRGRNGCLVKTRARSMAISARPTADAVIITHPHYNALIWRIRLRRIRRLERCECIRRNEQQPQHKSDDRCPISFIQPY